MNPVARINNYMKRNRQDKKSKEILTRLLVLYEHLDKLMALPKPRPENADLMIDAIHARIEREKQKLRK
jgi:hypothetical protein